MQALFGGRLKRRVKNVRINLPAVTGLRFGRRAGIARRLCGQEPMHPTQSGYGEFSLSKDLLNSKTRNYIIFLGLR